MSDIKMEIETNFDKEKLQEMSDNMSTEDFLNSLDHLDTSIQDDYSNRFNLLSTYLKRMQFYMNDNPKDVDKAVELISNYEYNSISELYEELVDSLCSRIEESEYSYTNVLEVVKKTDILLNKFFNIKIGELITHYNNVVSKLSNNEDVKYVKDYWNRINLGFSNIIDVVPEFKEQQENIIQNYPQLKTEEELEEQKENEIEHPIANVKDSEEYKELEKKHQLLYAEFDNFRKRTAKEKQNLIKSANKNIVLDLLETLDNFENASKTQGGLSEGIELTYKNFIKTLEKYGTENIKVDGEKLDTERMHPISKINVEESDKKGTVVETFQKGYSLNGEIIRFPKVVIGE